MRIGIIGFGRMGHLVQEVAEARNHQIAVRLSSANNTQGLALTAEKLAGVDVAIEFSIPEIAVDNIRRVVASGIPMVVGTTGWYDRIAEVQAFVEEQGGAVVYGTNFSLGMNLFYRLVERAAALFSPNEDYDPFLIEHHHKLKKDIPSGTALALEQILHKRYSDRTPRTVAIRAGYIPGTHLVGFDSEADTIRLVHTARNRSGFALGAVCAAERILTRRGFFEFSELLFGNQAPNSRKTQDD